MRVITAPETYEPSRTDFKVFLAGGITKCPDWQAEVIKQLGEHEYKNLVLFNPRRDNFPIGDAAQAAAQIAWEYEMLEQCDIFSMYFCASESDQPICMYELGRNIVRMQMRFPIDWEKRIVIDIEDGYRRKKDVIYQTFMATGSSAFIDSNSNPQDHASNILFQCKCLDFDVWRTCDDE